MVTPAGLPDGAPPLPPPGGYRHRRVAPREPEAAEPETPGLRATPPPARPGPASGEAPAGDQAGPTAEAEPSTKAEPTTKRQLLGARRVSPDAKRGPLGAKQRIPDGLARAVAVVTAVFVLGLLIALFAGAATVLWSVVPMLLQVGVVVLALAALRVPEARKVGVAALVVSLFLNVGTVAAMGMVGAAAQRRYPGVDTFAQQHARGFPGRKGYDRSDEADQQRHSPSYEATRDAAEGRLRLIREAVSAETGVEWVLFADATTAPVPNGYGGTSMFVRYTPSVWTTARPPRTVAEKTALTEAFVRVMSSGEGYSSVQRHNAPEAGLPPARADQRWGSEDPATQHTWETYAHQDGVSATLTIIDLEAPSADADLRHDRERMAPLFGEPVEGVILTSYGGEALPTDDLEEFIRRMQDYPGL